MSDFSVIKGWYQFANQEPVKETIKKLVALPTFFYGTYAFYNLLKDSYTVGFKKKQESDWVQVSSGVIKKIMPDEKALPLNKMKTIVRFISNFSHTLSSALTPPGKKITEWCFHLIASTEQLERFLGPNVNYATNPRHPRHILSFVSVFLSAFTLAEQIYNKKSILTLSNVIPIWSIVSSRPSQHTANQLFKKIYG